MYHTLEKGSNSRYWKVTWPVGESLPYVNVWYNTLRQASCRNSHTIVHICTVFMRD